MCCRIEIRGAVPLPALLRLMAMLPTKLNVQMETFRSWYLPRGPGVVEIAWRQEGMALALTPKITQPPDHALTPQAAMAYFELADRLGALGRAAVYQCSITHDCKREQVSNENLIADYSLMPPMPLNADSICLGFRALLAQGGYGRLELA